MYIYIFIYTHEYIHIYSYIYRHINAYTYIDIYIVEPHLWHLTPMSTYPNLPGGWKVKLRGHWRRIPPSRPGGQAFQGPLRASGELDMCVLSENILCVLIYRCIVYIYINHLNIYIYIHMQHLYMDACMPNM